MENYDLDIQWGTHIVRVKLQSGEFFGFVDVPVRGNCQGRAVIDTAIETVCDIPDPDVSGIVNPINLRIVEEEDEDPDEIGDTWFGCTLKNQSGEELDLIMDASEIESYVVGAEILSYISNEAEQGLEDT